MTRFNAFVLALLAAVLLAVNDIGVQAHASSRLRGIIGEDGPGNSKTMAVPLSLIREQNPDVPKGDLGCPKGKTLRIASLDAAQNPECVPCGSIGQFACNGATCDRGLKVLQSMSLVQPVCITDGSFRPRKSSRTARGISSRAAGNGDRAATVSVTKEVACGIAGWTCCEGNTCDVGCNCVGATCIPSRF